MMVECGEKNTFRDQVFTTFNDLPKVISIINNKKVFYREPKKHYRDRALALAIVIFTQYHQLKLPISIVASLFLIFSV